MRTGYLIDMDGVVYREDKLIPGAPEFIEALLRSSTPFLFLTNNSAPSPADLAVKMKHLGVSDLSPKHFYTSALNTADFLSEMHPGCTVYVIGEGGLVAALHERKIANDHINPNYVVVGEGTISMEKLFKAHECLERGARLIATNPDNWCPVSGEKTRPGAGSTAAYLEASSGSRAYYLGKPNGYMFTQARRRLAENSLNTVEQVVMIGDTMETDVRGAFEAGLRAYLVLTGSTELTAIGQYAYQPTRILNSVADLTQETLHGKPSSRMNSPALVNGNGNSRNRKGSKYHDISTLVKPRPRPRPPITG